MVEQPAVNRLVAGSNPARGAKQIKHLASSKKRPKIAIVRHLYGNGGLGLGPAPLPAAYLVASVQVAGSSCRDRASYPNPGGTAGFPAPSLGARVVQRMAKNAAGRTSVTVLEALQAHRAKAEREHEQPREVPDPPDPAAVEDALKSPTGGPTETRSQGEGKESCRRAIAQGQAQQAAVALEGCPPATHG